MIKLGFFLLLLMMVTAGDAMATDANWITTGTSAWETASNWSSAAVPSSNLAINARIANGGTAEITQAGQNSQYITLANGATKTGYIHLISGTLATSLDQNLCHSGVAIFTQEAGTTNTSGSVLVVGEQSGSRGTYQLNGGVLTVPGSDMTIGYLGGASGTFEQNGGSLGGMGSGSVKYLYLGRFASATGSYVMSNGSLLLTNNNYASIGQAGVGRFTQNNGTVIVDQQVNIGRTTGSYGEYTMNNGSFLARIPVLAESSGATGVVTVTGGTFQSSSTNVVGWSGCGSLYQSGGIVGASNQIILGFTSSGAGTYVLSGTGKLLLTNFASLYVGFDGNGTFIQSNGTVAVATNLTVGKNGNSIGMYRIQNGSIDVGQNLVIGESSSATGTLQVVGSNAVITAKGYQQTAGSTLDLQLDGGGVSPITVTGNAALNGTLKITGLALYSHSTTVTVINAATISGAFSKTNFVSPLISADIIYDTGNGDVKLTNFKYPQPVWVNPGAGAWEGTGNWASSTVPNRYDDAVVGNGGTAVITNSAAICGSLTLGNFANLSGSVQLSTGTLESVSHQNQGLLGASLFTQESGTTNLCGGFLYVGESSTQAIYRLNGGLLSVPNDEIDIAYKAGSTGTVEQSGGILGSLGFSRYLFLGRLAGAVGNYVMNGGSLLLTNNNYVSIGQAGSGYFTQNNGTVMVDQQFNIGRVSGGYGEYTMNNGSLLARWPVLGETSGATGIVAITGGTFSGGEKLSVGQYGFGFVRQRGGVVGVTNQYLYLGEKNTGVGVYQLSESGKLMLTNAANYLYIGFDGNGTFIQSNGTVAVANYLFVGKNSNAVGRCRVENGSMSIGQNLVLGESNYATGTFQVVGSTATITARIYQQNANSTLDIQFDAGGITPIIITNNASLSGELKITGNELYGNSATVTVINAGSLSGVFSRTNFVPPLISASIIYDLVNGDVKLTHFQYPAPTGSVFSLR